MSSNDRIKANNPGPKAGAWSRQLGRYRPARGARTYDDRELVGCSLTGAVFFGCDGAFLGVRRSSAVLVRCGDVLWRCSAVLAITAPLRLDLVHPSIRLVNAVSARSRLISSPATRRSPRLLGIHHRARLTRPRHDRRATLRPDASRRPGHHGHHAVDAADRHDRCVASGSTFGLTRAAGADYGSYQMPMQAYDQQYVDPYGGYGY